MDLVSKDHLLWKEVITTETHLVGIFIQEKVLKYKLKVLLFSTSPRKYLEILL